jgi:periplasmic mercuric ion binding protein
MFYQIHTSLSNQHPPQRTKQLIMKKLCLLLLVFMPFLAMSQNTEIEIKTTAVCDECKEAVEKALMDEKGVKFASLDVATKKVKVVYNASKTTPEQLRKAISMAGYDADDVPADPEVYKRLKPCCTKEKACEDVKVKH